MSKPSTQNLVESGLHLSVLFILGYKLLIVTIKYLMVYIVTWSDSSSVDLGAILKCDLTLIDMWDITLFSLLLF